MGIRITWEAWYNADLWAFTNSRDLEKIQEPTLFLVSIPSSNEGGDSLYSETHRKVESRKGFGFFLISKSQKDIKVKEG